MILEMMITEVVTVLGVVEVRVSMMLVVVIVVVTVVAW